MRYETFYNTNALRRIQSNYHIIPLYICYNSSDMREASSRKLPKQQAPPTHISPNWATRGPGRPCWRTCIHTRIDIQIHTQAIQKGGMSGRTYFSHTILRDKNPGRTSWRSAASPSLSDASIVQMIGSPHGACGGAALLRAAQTSRCGSASVIHTYTYTYKHINVHIQRRSFLAASSGSLADCVFWVCAKRELFGLRLKKYCGRHN